jgi:hypothetical protein
LRAQPIDVSLESASGQRLAHVELEPSRAGIHDSAGELTLPNLEGATWTLDARTRVGDRPVSAKARVHVTATSPPRALEERSLRVLQQFSEGPIVAAPNEVAPSSLRVRIAGGACVPELPCHAFVHVGEPAARIRIESNSAVSEIASPPSAAAAISGDVPIPATTTGVVELSFVTHGPEAELWLTAERDGRKVARRAVRLPIAMAALHLETSALMYGPSEVPRLRVPGSDEGCIVDAFADGQWERTGSLARCDRDTALPFALPPGMHRLQVRRDPFSSDTCGVALIILRGAESQTDALSALALAARALDPDDPIVRAAIDRPASIDRASAGYLAALLERGIATLPAPVTGYADELAEQQRRQARLRNLSLFALALGALALVLSVGRRGLSAGARAREFLARESLDPNFTRRALWRSRAIVAASVSSLALVFAVIALYVLARGGY